VQPEVVELPQPLHRRLVGHRGLGDLQPERIGGSAPADERLRDRAGEARVVELSRREVDRNHGVESPVPGPPLLSTEGEVEHPPEQRAGEAHLLGHRHELGW
jgi:hypothetical protein